jgi:hypothetical protein
MQTLIRRFGNRLYTEESFVSEWRRGRMRQMFQVLRLPPRARIVDLGGSEMLWRLLDHDCHVTLVNLPGWNCTSSDPDRFTVVEADACNLQDVFGDMSFDAVYSNSTIEHVGDESRQAWFAAAARRLAPAYWVQTPSSRFPIEIHTGIPFYWSLPALAREHLLRQWHRKLPAWTDMIKETRVLSRERMRTLFPDAEIFIERRFGFEKSYSFYRPYPGDSPDRNC